MDPTHSHDRRSRTRDRRRPAVAGGADRGLSRPHRRARRRIALLCAGAARRGVAAARRPNARSATAARAARCTASRSASRISIRRGASARRPGRGVYLDHVPDEDAESWVRLRDAGAILLGKQETHEFAIGGPDFTLPFPPARNPWNTAHYPAGSSSGTAVAVGARPVRGSDGVGHRRLDPRPGCLLRSCRAEADLWPGQPARGLPAVLYARPLRAADPYRRGLRDDDAGAGRLRSAGPGLGRCPGPRLPRGARHPARRHDDRCHPPLPREGRGRRFRAGERAVAGLYRGVRRSLPDAGKPRCAPRRSAAVAAARFPRRQPGHHDGRGLCAARDRFPRAAASVRASHVRPDRARRVSQRRGLRRGGASTPRTVLEMAEALAGVDAIVSANATGPAPRIDAVGTYATFERASYTAPYNVTGLPAMSVPIGFENGLPLAFQLAGKPFDEAAVLRVGYAFEQASDVHLSRPPLAAPLPGRA